MATERDALRLTDEPTPTAVLTPETVRDVRERAARRDGKGWEFDAVHVGVLYALCDVADELARERRRVAELRTALAEIKQLTDAASEATMTRSTLDLAWRVGRIAERHMPVMVEEADAPGPGGEGEGQ